MRQNERRRLVNKAVRTQVKTKVKDVIEAVDEKNATKAKDMLVEVTRSMYRASTKGVVHKNNAARKVSRLTKKVRALG
jgi:small subunit ribosomal protein S20